MKKTSQKEVTFCDVCGVETYYAGYHCIRCGADHCYDCSKTHGVSYTHGVHFSGSGDGYYCKACDTQLAEKGDDPRHQAYLKIRKLCQEESDWYSDFSKRRESAEANVKLLS